VLAPPETDPEAVALAERHRPNWAMAMGAALVLICVLAVVGFVTRGGSGGNSPSRTTAQFGNHPSPPAGSPSPNASQRPNGGQVAQLPPTRATMLVRAIRGETWLRITAKSTGQVLYEGTLVQGAHKLVSNKQPLEFTIGNAPAVDLVVNGHDIGAPPSVGNVSNGQIAPGDTNIEHA
jgi:hypothetical protein